MKKNGFTLIELILVVAVIGILLGIAGMAGREWWGRSRVEAQMKELYADLYEAKINALYRSRVYFVTFAPNPAAAVQYNIFEDTAPAPDGDGVLDIVNDARIRQKNMDTMTLAIPGAVGTGEIDLSPRGLVDAGLIGTTTRIRAISAFRAAYDCIEITETSIRMGVWNAGTCATR